MNKKTNEIEYKWCPVCGKGLMRYVGVLTPDPPEYRHRCDACGAIEGFDRIYPYVEEDA